MLSTSFKYIRITLLLYGIFFVTLLSTAYSKEPLKLVTIEFPPYVYVENGRVTGFNTEIIREVFRRMNMEVEVMIVPWIRGLHMIKQGTADALFPMLITEERSKYTDFTHEFTYEETSLFVRNDSRITWQGDIDSLLKYTFGRVRGYSSGEIIDDLVERKKLTIDDASTTSKNLDKLIGKRVDILVGTRHVILEQLHKRNQQDAVRLLTVIQRNPACLGFSKKRIHQVTIARFNETLESMKQDGSYTDIMDDFGSSD